MNGLCSLSVLLIEPQGIEILFRKRFLKPFALLIEPQGIEISHLMPKQLNSPPF